MNCVKCGAAHECGNQRYCTECHNAYMREWRKTHRLNAEQRAKASTRRKSNMYKARGKLAQQSCAHCGSPDSQMHHHDYSKPLEVEWLCRPCHMDEHRKPVDHCETHLSPGAA